MTHRACISDFSVDVIKHCERRQLEGEFDLASGSSRLDVFEDRRGVAAGAGS